MQLYRATIFIITALLTSGNAKAQQGDNTNDKEDNAHYWFELGQQTLHSSLHIPHIEKVAKNVIFFLGDGMGIPTVTATRIYKGQKAGKRGEEEHLEFDKFPYVSLSKTYALDRQNPDSANTATAYLSGVKANYGTLGVNGRVTMGDCRASKENSTHVKSILQWAQEAGKWTGLVTSTRVTHATPAGLYAHSASRDWESSAPEGCDDIASQLIHHLPGKDIRVILGGGRRKFLPSTGSDVAGQPGTRNDSRDLLSDWMDDKKARGMRAKTIWDLNDFRNLKTHGLDFLLGLFSSNHLPYVADRDANRTTPTLDEMTKMAIDILSHHPQGFFLLVEGGRIDMAHHKNLAMKALEEGVEFDRAVKVAVETTNVNDTLIVVTADHSHTFTIGGDYPLRGNNILGLGGVSDIDNLTLTTLSYANGPGYKGLRKNLTEQEVVQKDYQQDVTVPLSLETHGAEDVPVYARGPMAHLFHGVHDQTYIPYVIGYASCVGPNTKFCTAVPSSSASSSPLHELRCIGIVAFSVHLKIKLIFNAI